MIRMTTIDEAIWLTFKFGDLNWMEAPYSPHLTNQAEMPRAITRACSDFMISVVDTTNGEVKFCGRYAFGPEFSGAFRAAASMLYDREFDRVEYDHLLEEVQKHYSTEDIASAAIAECGL